VELGAASGAGLSLYVNENDDYDVSRISGSGGFLHYPYFLDVEPFGQVESFDSYISAVERLLDGLRAGNQEFVTACDFEDHLRDKRASPPRQISP